MGVNTIAKFRPEIISYKGHGQIERATRSGSVGHVLLHELRHKAEFEAEARSEGRRIVHENVEIEFAFRDGFLVAVAGKTTATTVPEKDGEEITPPSEEGRQPQPDKSPSSADIKDSFDDSVSKSHIEQRLNMAEQQANSALLTIETRLRRGDGEVSVLESKRAKLQQIKAEVERLKRQVQAEQGQAGVERTLQTVAQADQVALRMIVTSASPSDNDQQDQHDGTRSTSRDTDRHVLPRLTDSVRRRADMETSISRIITSLSTVAPLGGVIDVEG